MAAIQPTDLFAGYELLAATDPAPSQGVFIPLSVLSNLTAAEANETTGDGRKLAFEICRQVFSSVTGLATADRPSKMSVSRGTPTGVDATTVRQSYTLTFDLDVSSSDVAAE